MSTDKKNIEKIISEDLQDTTISVTNITIQQQSILDFTTTSDIENTEKIKTEKLEDETVSSNDFTIKEQSTLNCIKTSDEVSIKKIDSEELLEDKNKSTTNSAIQEYSILSSTSNDKKIGVEIKSEELLQDDPNSKTDPNIQEQSDLNFTAASDEESSKKIDSEEPVEKESLSSVDQIIQEQSVLGYTESNQEESHENLDSAELTNNQSLSSIDQTILEQSAASCTESLDSEINSSLNLEFSRSKKGLNSEYSVTKKKEFVTLQQRELIFSYMVENPELITHSSTFQNERKLWKELISQLNALKPVKSSIFWRNFWRKWQERMTTGKKKFFTKLDEKLHKYLKQISQDETENDLEKKTKRKITLKEISDRLNKIEETKMHLNFELDELTLAVLTYKNFILEKEQRISELKKKREKLIKAKRHWNMRKDSIILENNNNAQYNGIKKKKLC